MGPTRAERRQLQKRADKARRKILGLPLPEGCTAAYVGFLTEQQLAICEPNDAAAQLVVWGCAEVVEEIEAERKRRPDFMPVVIIIDGWIQLSWSQVGVLARGGDA